MSEQIPLRIGYLPILDHLTLGIAHQTELQEFTHFKLEVQMFSNWSELRSAVENKEVDGAFLLFPLALDIYRTHPDWKVVLLGHREGQVLVTTKNITTVAQLRDKTIHVPDRLSTHYLLLHRILQKSGLDIQSDVQIKAGYHDIRQAADELAQQETDAYLIAEPMGTHARRRGLGHIIAASSGIDAHHVDCVLVLRDNVIQNNSEAGAELVDSLVRAGMFINAYPRQSAEIGEAFLGWPAQLLLEALTHHKGHIIFWDLLPRLEDFTELQDIAVNELSLWPSICELDDFVYPHFAQQAYRQWVITERQAANDKGSARTVPGNLKEAARKLAQALESPSIVTGVKIIRVGEKYPKSIPKNTISIAEALDGAEGSFVNADNAGQDVKDFVLFSPLRSVDPDRVLIGLSEQQAQVCLKALHYGRSVSIESVTSQEDFLLLAGHEPVITSTFDDMIVLSLSYQVFLLLPVLITRFGGSV